MKGLEPHLMPAQAHQYLLMPAHGTHADCMLAHKPYCKLTPLLTSAKPQVPRVEEKRFARAGGRWSPFLGPPPPSGLP